MKKKLLVGLIAGSAVFAAVYGAAATLNGVNSTTLGAGNTAVASCDPDGVATSYGVSYAAAGYKVDSVKVSGISAACDAKSLSITLTTSGASYSATGTVSEATTAGEETLSISNGPAAADVTGIHVVING